MSETIHFETLGCRLNQDETEGSARVFALNGFSIDMESVTSKTEPNENVVLCVINTCTVTSKAEQKARRIIRLMLEKFCRALVLVTGCYAELDGEEITAICPERISVLPGSKKFLLARIALAMGDGSGSCSDSDSGHVCISVKAGRFCHEGLDLFILEGLRESEKRSSLFGGGIRASATSATSASSGGAGAGRMDAFTLYTPVFEKHSRASIKIEDGCNNECAFCRIHLARGKAVSLDVESVVERVKELEAQGASEVVFTGVNLSQYKGALKEETVDFNGLLKILLECTDRIKFRISSFYPQHITDELCMTLSSPRVQPFFHLSIQSGSNRILREMRRPYDRDQVILAVERLRKAKDNPFISCDIIAGFPGESDEDFALTQDLCQKCRFSWIHAFPFSPRQGTPAYSMKPQIPERIKDERVKWLTSCAVSGKVEYINEWCGKEVWAIVEKSRLLRLSGHDGESEGKSEGKSDGKSLDATDAVINTSKNTKADSEPPKKKFHGVTENFLHVEYLAETGSSGDVSQGTLVRVRIDRVLEENIRSGKELECMGTFAGIK